MVEYFVIGMHEPGGEHLMSKYKGWILFIHELGADPANQNGFDYSPWADQGYQIIARLNHGYGEAGTIPLPEKYGDFAQRVANFVANSVGCQFWIIGNEPNHSQERPGKVPILPSQYATCFNLCAAAIFTLGRGNDRVMPAPVASWNTETKYPGNEAGDWVKYQTDMLLACNPDFISGIPIHTYTHGSDPALITSLQTMDPPYESRYYHFRQYINLLEALPSHLHGLPIFITETNQLGDGWENINRGWIQAALLEVARWNDSAQTIGQIVACICYRWPHFDRWYIQGLGEVEIDFQRAAEFGIYADINNGGGEVPDGDDNLILNPGFEEGFRLVEGIGELKVGNNWFPWWHSTDTRPEFRDGAPHADRIHSGSHAQQWFNTYATHTGGIYQPITGIEPGKKIELSGFVQTFTRNDDSDFSTSTGRYRMRIGFDPYGGIDPESKDVVWSETIQPYDKWYNLSIEGVTKSDRITIFVWGQAEWRFKHNNAYTDDLSLVYLGDAEPPDPTDPPVDGGECDPISSGAAGLAMAAAQCLIDLAGWASSCAEYFHDLVIEWLPEGENDG